MKNNPVPPPSSEPELFHAALAEPKCLRSAANLIGPIPEKEENPK